MPITSEDVRKIRTKLDLTQIQLSKILSITESSIHRIEAGRQNPGGMVLNLLLALKTVIETRKPEEVEKLKKSVHKTLIIGGTLATQYALLKDFFKEDEQK